MRTRRLLKALAFALLALLAAEGLCALTESPSKYRLSPSTGFELVPGWRGGGADHPETINAAGLRGAELAPRQPGVLRILCMGESTTWGHKVGDDQTWPYALEQHLRAAGASVEVLNGGVSGWGLEQILRALQDGLLRRLQPDVVLVFAGWNAPRLEANPQVARFRAALAREHEGGLLARSALARRLRDWSEEPAEGQGRLRREFAQLAAEAFPELAPELATACEDHGARLAFIRFPALAQRELPQGPALRAAWEELLAARGEPDADVATLAADARALHAAVLAAVEQGAQAAGAPLIDLAARLPDTLPADRDAADTQWTAWFRDALHFTPAGNEAVGHAVAVWLAGSGWLAAPAADAR